tara:strand:- start:10 stop:237 length:228 start_codon:yes stop_codon:yes gene_type:complete
MPLYEYECQKCGHKFEKLVKLNSANPVCTLAISTGQEKILERCDGDTKKLISKNNFHLKGEGWYKDGYTKKQNTK